MAPDLGLLSRLVGVWTGPGRGIYPTIPSFEYVETVTITAPPKPFLAYHQATKHPTTGAPMHTEVGYFRMGAAPGDVELMIAQPSGITEVHTGHIEEVDGVVRLDLHAATIGRSPSSKLVSSVSRFIEIEGDILRNRLSMGSVGQPHQLHLSAELQRS